MTVVTAVCCREWPVLLGAPIGKCGYCGRVPVIDWEWK
jgi:hypothetical protein